MTILEVIQRSSDFLAKRGVESPRLQAELLLAHTLKMPRLNLYLNFSRVLTQPELDTIRALVMRRGQHEPLQHVVGSSSFCGVEIAVSPDVLIPRPETEVLAELAWTSLNALANSESGSPTVLDFGTGSGCLAILLALKTRQSKIYALDISVRALRQAQANAEVHKVTDRITFVQSDGFLALPQDLQFDMIVANPPYIPTADLVNLQTEVRDYDPSLALNGGVDGLDFFRHLAEQALRFLKRDGKLLAEFGDGQEKSVARLLLDQGWTVEQVTPDLSGRPRIIVARTCRA